VTLLWLTACGDVGLTRYDSLPDSPPADSTPAPTGGDTKIRPEDSGKPVEDSQPPDSREEVDPIPRVTVFIAEEDGDKVKFGFAVIDEDKDFKGGSVTLRVLGQNKTYAYPDQVLFTEGGNPYVSWSLSDFKPSEATSCILSVEDAAGHASEPVTTTFTRSAWIKEVDENGDDAASTISVGKLAVPGKVKGTMGKTGNDGSNYTKDLDWVKFTAPSTGTLSLTLTWSESSADYDLYLLQTDLTVLASSATTKSPEALAASVRKDETYIFVVAGWSGPGGDWTVEFK
jgi:hypothetical protein